ncbi:MAG: hypothetical protein JNL70_02995 [Saprospiraceae bacterium]|nr:hypothetical protein [Saprospiraceae bacterium]
MAAQVYDQNNKILFEFNMNSEIEQSFNELFKHTGVYIDVYGDTRLYKNHSQILINFLDKKGNALMKMTKEFRENLFLSLQNEILYIIGD